MFCCSYIYNSIRNRFSNKYMWAYKNATWIAYINATKIKWKGYLFQLSAIMSEVSQFVAVVALHFWYIFLCTAFALLMLICTLVVFGSTSARATLPYYLALVFALKPIWFALPIMGDKGCRFGRLLALHFQFHMRRYISKVFDILVMGHDLFHANPWIRQGSYYSLHLLLISNDISSSL